MKITFEGKVFLVFLVKQKKGNFWTTGNYNLATKVSNNNLPLNFEQFSNSAVKASTTRFLHFGSGEKKTLNTFGNGVVGQKVARKDKKRPKRQNREANSIQCSQAVTHPSTDWTQHCLTSVIGRELVCSMWYGRWHLKVTITLFLNLSLIRI